jgi:hypothetical protein
VIHTMTASLSESYVTHNFAINMMEQSTNIRLKLICRLSLLKMCTPIMLALSAMLRSRTVARGIGKNAAIDWPPYRQGSGGADRRGGGGKRSHVRGRSSGWS